MMHPVYLFFDIGGGEIILIGLVALLLFGGDKLPELARGLGKGIRDFKDASEGVKREIANQIDSYERKKAEEKAAETPVHTEEDPAISEPVAAEEAHVPNTIPIRDNYIPAADDPDFVTH